MILHAKMSTRPRSPIREPRSDALGESEVIEEVVRRYLGLDLMERLWSRNDMPEEEAMSIATEAQRDARRKTNR